MRTMSRMHTHRSIDSIEYYVQVHTHTQTHSQIQLTINQKFMFPLLRRCYCRSHSSLLSKLSAISRSLVRRMAVNCVCVRCAVRPSSYHGILLLLYVYDYFSSSTIFFDFVEGRVEKTCCLNSQTIHEHGSLKLSLAHSRTQQSTLFKSPNYFILVLLFFFFWVCLFMCSLSWISE